MYSYTDHASSRVVRLVCFGFIVLFPLLPHHVFSSVTGPVYVLKYVGEDAKFTWSTTNSDPFIRLQFGISNAAQDDIKGDGALFATTFSTGDMIVPRNTTDPVYRGRLYFYGDLSSGHVTFEIKNITVSDANTYLVKIREQGYSGSGYNVKRKGTLTIRVAPTFTSQLNSPHDITEGQDLSITCSATGVPTPNITWIWNTDDSAKDHGTGSATLIIPGITRDKKGIYECQAINDPAKSPIKIQTTVNVQYLPEIDASSSSSNTSSWKGNQIILKCKAIGVPTPTFEWFSPNGNEVSNGVTVVSGGSQVIKVTTENSVDYGQYKCRATNRQGSDERSIHVTQLFPPGPPVVSIHDIKAVSFTLKWIAPANNGGSVVIDYKVEVSTKTRRENIIGSELTLISELDKDTEYTVRVFARNVVGYGTAGTKTIRTKKQGPPSSPILKSEANETTDTELLLQWSKSDENGGIINKYTIYFKVTKEKAWRERHVIPDGSVLEYKVKDLEAGKTYSFLVTATNDYGESAKDYTKAMVIRITKAKKGQAVDKEPCNCTYSTIIGACASTIALLVIVNVLLLVYIWRREFKESRVMSTKLLLFTRNPQFLCQI